MGQSEENELRELRDRLDPIQFEVIRNALVASTEEMATTLRRSAFSTNIKTRGDFSLRIFRPSSSCFRPGVHPNRCILARWWSLCLARFDHTARRSLSRAICWLPMTPITAGFI